MITLRFGVNAHTQTEHGAENKCYPLLAQLYQSSSNYIHKASSRMPKVNCEFFPTVGLKGEEAAASQTSSSGVDMSVWQATDDCDGGAVVMRFGVL
jgi:hypothetical protein